jgi:hypothetical protein
MDDAQLELSLGEDEGHETENGLRRPGGKATGWFGKIRTLVKRVLNREDLPNPRPEQIWFSEPHRTPNSQFV